MTNVTMQATNSKRLTIVITTKDRWKDLTQTLTDLHKIGLGEVKVLIVDDGSASSGDRSIESRFPNCRMLREDHSLGLVIERNRLADRVDTEFLISLDDDACLTSADHLDEALEYMDQNVCTAALAFPVKEATGPRARAASEYYGTTPVGVRSFNGGAHLLRLSAFRQVGGYRNYFYYMVEERDLSMRLYRAGMTVVVYPDVQVLHRKAALGRSDAAMCYFRAQNTLLCWLLNAPQRVSWYRAFRTAAHLILLSLPSPHRAFATLSGVCAGMGLFLLRRAERQPMSNHQYRKWERLPEVI